MVTPTTTPNTVEKVKDVKYELTETRLVVVGCDCIKITLYVLSGLLFVFNLSAIIGASQESATIVNAFRIIFALVGLVEVGLVLYGTIMNSVSILKYSYLIGLILIGVMTLIILIAIFILIIHGKESNQSGFSIAMSIILLICYILVVIFVRLLTKRLDPVVHLQTPTELIGIAA